MEDTKAKQDVWLQDQMKPLSMFVLAKQWMDAIKVIAAGNGAGIVGAGAALNSFSQRHDLLAWIKFAGATYFVGVFAFAYAFYCIHSGVLAFDDMLHATREKDATAVQLCSRTTGTMMMRANHLAIVGARFPYIGTGVGLFVLIRF